MNNNLAVFENYKIRRVFDEATETWYFSVVDIIQALIQQPNFQAARNYWKENGVKKVDEFAILTNIVLGGAYENNKKDNK